MGCSSPSAKRGMRSRTRRSWFAAVSVMAVSCRWRGCAARARRIRPPATAAPPAVRRRRRASSQRAKLSARRTSNRRSCRRCIIGATECRGGAHRARLATELHHRLEGVTVTDLPRLARSGMLTQREVDRDLVVGVAILAAFTFKPCIRLTRKLRTDVLLVSRAARYQCPLTKNSPYGSDGALGAFGRPCSGTARVTRLRRKQRVAEQRRAARVGAARAGAMARCRRPVGGADGEIECELADRSAGFSGEQRGRPSAHEARTVGDACNSSGSNASVGRER